MTPPFVTRFAPSPNGYLHLGHAYSAITAFNAAQAASGIMLLRIDDIDTQRARKKFVDAIVEDLGWLGLSWPKDIRLQSAHRADYDAAADMLIARGLTYPCFCVRKSVKMDERGHYCGTCRTLGENEIADRLNAGEEAAIRLNVEACWSALDSRTLRYMDTGIHQHVERGSLEDAVVIRKDIGSSYLLSCVVDDAAQNITHVIRGKDIQGMTGLQVLLQHLLDLPTPGYHHHALISDAAHTKLSKSKGAPSLREMRGDAVTPADIYRQLGFNL